MSRATIVTSCSSVMARTRVRVRTVPTFRAVQAAGARRVMALAVGDVVAEADVD